MTSGRRDAEPFLVSLVILVVKRLTPTSICVPVMFMFDAPADTTAQIQGDSARRKAQLVRLAAIGMEMAEQIKTDFDEAKTPEARREAMGDFPHVARLVQRAIFLEAKLERDDRIEARLVARGDREMSQEAVLRRKASVQAVVDRVIELAHGHSGSRQYNARQRLRWQLNECFLEADFADRPLDEVIGVLCKSVGLPKPPAIGDNADLWAINLRREDTSPPPAAEPPPDNDIDDDDEDDGLDPFGRRPPVTSSA
jgi:hypothetical protein